MRLPRIGPAIAVLVAVLPAAALAQKTAAKPQADPLRAPYQALATGDYAKAEQGFRALLSGQRRGKALLGLGRVQLETGRYAEAEESAATATASPGLGGRAHTLRGEALYVRGKLDQAQRAFELAVKSKEALRARVLLGRLLLERGKKPEGEAQLLAVIEAYNDDRLPKDGGASLSYVAMAARALGSWHDANDAFREAAMADRSRVETQLEWAQLFLEKYDLQHAEESVLEALEHNPKSPLAHTLMARLAIARAVDLPAASEHLDEALAVNPSLVAAHVTRAAIALREMDIDAADFHLQAALTVDPNDLEALSVRAAARFLADDAPGFARAKSEVLARNPHYSRMYSIVAEYAEWEHRYEELVAMARDALAIDDEDPLAYATLGMNLLRAGDEKGGLLALRSAWARDRFNVQVYNTLNFYEQVLDQEYTSFEARPFVFRTHKEERAALEPYVVPTLRAAYEGMRKRYAFTPRGPLRIELYADTEHFSVRTTGLPNVGVQGVCFGQVITALSPRGGPFNWGQITWHELAHVFHLQLSRNRVPRWFTEGLAEYETIIARPEWKREEDYDLWVALKQDRVPPLRELNKAFTQARTPEALMTAYYVASRAVGYIVERFGWVKVRAMLEGWGKGLRTREVVSTALGVDIEQIDADFRAFTRHRLKHYDDDFYVDFARYEDVDALEVAVKKSPDDADALAALSLGLVARGRFPEAEKAGLLATKRVKGHPLAHFALTRVALEAGDAGRAEEHLRSIVAGGQDGYILRILLARSALAGRNTQEATRDAEAAIAIDPEQLEAYRVLLEIAEKTKDKKLGLRALRAIADLDQHDKVSHLALMVALEQERAYPDLVKAGERALFLDPEEPGVHRLLGEAYLETGKAKQALVELDRGVALSADPSGELMLSRARALIAVGRAQEGRAAAAAAAAKDPTLKARAEALGGSAKPPVPTAGKR